MTPIESGERPAMGRSVALDPRFRAYWRPALLLSVAALATFGPHAGRLGFYLDDWTLSELMRGTDGWWARVRALAVNPSRSLQMLYYPTVHQWMGAEPSRGQALLLIQDWGASAAFFVFLRRWLGSPRLALTAAALALTYPICPATHHWICNMPQQSALLLTLMSLIAHLEWLETRRPLHLRLALTAYAASLLLYEAAAFFPLMQGAAWFMRLRSRGTPTAQAARAALRDILPYGLVLALAAVWQRFAVHWLMGTQYPKSAELSFRWAAKVYSSALESLSLGAWSLARNTGRAWRELFPGPMQAALPLFAASMGWALARTRTTGARAHALPAAAAMAAAGFFAAYLPFALSGKYEPQVVGIMSRTNGSGVFVGGIALAALLEAVVCGFQRARLPGLGRSVHGGVLAIVLAAFTWTNWYIARQWVEAWRIERDIVAKVAEWVQAVPSAKVIALMGAPPHFNGSEVFSEAWGFSSAIRMATGRDDIRGLIVKSTMSTDSRGLVDHGVTPAAIVPYAGLFLYEYSSNRLIRPVPANP